MYVLRFGEIVKRNALKPSDYYLTRKKEITRHHVQGPWKYLVLCANPRTQKLHEQGSKAEMWGRASLQFEMRFTWMHRQPSG